MLLEHAKFSPKCPKAVIFAPSIFDALYVFLAQIFLVPCFGLYNSLMKQSLIVIEEPCIHP